ncbi:transposase [Geomonas ferrireducens]|uniref:transposase n=1 Tax=Geomonas ferrireducens TaxID=2570227 RepID=UPI0010A8CA81|nr:transposase [Geomonas ferrireducens]
MARRQRIHFPGAHYHVILRGNDRQDIFYDEVDRYKFYLLLQEGIERFGHSILSFCLMTNHVHLLCQVSDVPLSRIIQNLAFRYTRWINWRQKRVGHLFQGRYRAILVDADEYLLQLTSYIHLNPIRANLVKDPSAYPWSSHRAYVGKEVLPWLRMEPVLAYFGNNMQRARSAFLDFVNENIQNGHCDVFSHGDIADTRFLGPDDFVDKIHDNIEPEHMRKPAIPEIIEAVERLYGLTGGGLVNADRSFKMAEARSMVAWAVREMSDDTLTDLGHVFGRDVTTLSSSITRLTARSKSDHEIAERMKNLHKILVDFATLQA